MMRCIDPCINPRLLKYDVNVANKVINGTHPVIAHFSEDLTPEIQDKIFDEFNTFSVIYKSGVSNRQTVGVVALLCRCPAATFIDSETALFTIDEGFSEAAQTAPSEAPEKDSSFLRRNESDVERLSIGEMQMLSSARTHHCLLLQRQEN